MVAALAVDYALPFSGSRWRDVLPRSAALPQLEVAVLLHAGPPFRGMPPAPVMHAAIQALLFEGLAANATAARQLLLAGSALLRPAQDYGVVTPLAQVVSASMPLVTVQQGNCTAYAPLIEGANPALRFGSMEPLCRQRLREVSNWVARDVAPLVRSAPLSVEEIIRAAVAGGDECHARTAIANEAMLSQLVDINLVSAARLRQNPGFVLTVLMAAAAAAMRNHHCKIVAIGGNGLDFGVRGRGEDTWHQVPGKAPRGSRLVGLEDSHALAAIGDSAVIDFCGLGGQALAAAPALGIDWKGMLPSDALVRRRELIDPHSGIVAPERIVRAFRAPLINLAILDRDGAAGLIGRGFYEPPVDLFAMQRLI